MGTPLSRQASNRTSSAQPSYRSSLEKTELQKKIDGDTGPAMIGVSSYPYSRSQSSYREDFEMLVASTITHPYISTTNMGETRVKLWCPELGSSRGEQEAGVCVSQTCGVQ